MENPFNILITQGINVRKRTELLGEIEVVKEQLFLQKLKKDAADKEWTAKAEELLKDAADKAFNDIDMGWRLLKIARRLLIEGYDINQCLSRIKVLLGSLDRVDEGTRTTIASLFPLDDTGGTTIYDSWDLGRLKTNLSNALQQYDWYFDNEYSKLDKSRINLRKAMGFFWAGSAMMPFLYLLAIKFCDMEEFMGDWKNLWFVEVFGWLGAAFSIVTRITTSDKQTGASLPDSMKDGENLMYRSLIGPGAALLMFLFVHSGIINPNIFYLTQTNGTPAITQNISVTLPDSTERNMSLNLPTEDTPDSSKVDTTNATTNDNVAPNESSGQANQSKPTATVSTQSTEMPDKLSYLILVLSFLAGFSERLVIQILEKLTDKVNTVS